MLPSVRRGILGGTFDPPHLAHLVAGEAAFRELDLDVVTYIPAGAPWQKAGTVVSDPEHRWEMTIRAVGGVHYFEADDREITRDGRTYTADTLALFPPADEIFLVLGADAAARIPSWHRPDEVLERCRVAVMRRLGTSTREVEAAVGACHWLDTPLLDVSGTGLRQRRRAGMSIRFLVPDEVLAYIEAAGLYGPE